MVDNNKIMPQIFLIKFFQVFRLAIFILTLAYFLGSFWFILTKQTTKSDDQYTYYNEYSLGENEDHENMVIVVYFIFTTLCTVGFGDFNPKSDIERAVTAFILLMGVTSFSYIMGQFISILLNVQSITAENEDSENMSRWLIALKHFNKNRPLPVDLTKRIEKHFEYVWKNDRNCAIASEEDLEIFSELPVSCQGRIFKDFLFKDFLDMFRVHFTFTKPELGKGGVVKHYEWVD